MEEKLVVFFFFFYRVQFRFFTCYQGHNSLVLAFLAMNFHCTGERLARSIPDDKNLDWALVVLVLAIVSVFVLRREKMLTY